MVNKPENKQVAQTYSYYPPTGADPLGEFEANHRSYQLFREKGLDRDGVDVDQDGKPISTTNKILDDLVFRRVRRFLSNVDVSKGPIQRRVRLLERRRDLGQDNRMHEYLVVHVQWEAKDFLGNPISWHDFREGLCNDPVVRTSIVKNKKEISYVNWKPVYDIPFSPKAVNDALEDQLNPPEIVKYMVRPSQTVRDGTFSLEQFRDTTWEQAVEISRTGKGLNR